MERCRYHWFECRNL